MAFNSRIIFSVQTDDDGIDLDVFERLLEETPAPTETKYPFRRMLYVMTVYHNPMGSCLPLGEDRRVLSLMLSRVCISDKVTLLNE